MFLRANSLNPVVYDQLKAEVETAYSYWMKNYVSRRNEDVKKYTEKVYKKCLIRSLKYFHIFFIINHSPYRKVTDDTEIREDLVPLSGNSIDLSDEDELFAESESSDEVTIGDASVSGMIINKTAPGSNDVVAAPNFRCMKKKCAAFDKDFKGPGKLEAHKRCVLEFFWYDLSSYFV